MKVSTVHVEDVARRKFRAYKKSFKVLHNLRDIFLAQLCAQFFSILFFCATFFSLWHLKIRNTFEWVLNERFETNIEGTVNSL